MTEEHQLPAPLVGADVDLRDFAFMPLDVLRLRDSDLSALSSGDEFKAAVLLWCSSWHQVPAGSIPNDERWLARHSGAGRDWPRVQAEAMRGWTECSDGRLYHPVIAEKANEAWARKQDQRARTLKARIVSLERKLNESKREEDKSHLRGLLQALKNDLVALSHDLLQAADSSVTRSVTDPVTRSVTASNRQGQGQGQGQIKAIPPNPPRSRKPKPVFDPTPIELPAWLPRQDWIDFCKHREDLRSPLTELAAQKTLKALAIMREHGHEPVAVLEQSIANGWIGIFEPKVAAGPRGTSKVAQFPGRPLPPEVGTIPKGKYT